jgi:hypothetical protein
LAEVAISSTNSVAARIAPDDRPPALTRHHVAFVPADRVDRFVAVVGLLPKPDQLLENPAKFRQNIPEVQSIGIIVSIFTDIHPG